MFKVSDDGGASFGTPISLSSNAGATIVPACDDITTSFCRGFPQLAVAGNSVYVIWQDNDGIDDEIFFRKTTDDGATFSPSLSADATNLSSDDDISTQAKIAATGTDVHVVWVGIDSTIFDVDIFYSRSIDGGVNFDAPVILSDNIDETFSVMPDLAVAGDNVYVVWQEDIDFTFSFDIFFRASTDKGASFGSIVNLYNNDFFVSQNPDVVAAGNSVYVTWEDNDDGDFDIFFRRSIDNGITFDPDTAVTPDNLSSNLGNSDKPRVSTNLDGTKVYVAWEDDDDGDDDILFLSSTNSGDTFGSQIDISSNSGASVNPRMDASGDSVYVIWEDDTLGDPLSDSDIFFKSSDDGGATFSGFQDLSNDDGFARFQQVSSSGGDVFVVWRDEGVLDPTTGEIFFRAGSPSATGVSFDQSEYKLSDTATITVIDTPGAGLVSVTVFSSVDAGFSVDLPETGPGTGIYTGTITFTTDSSVPASAILKVETGGSITAAFGAEVGNASMFARTTEFQFVTYNLNDGAVGSAPVIITVTDQNSNADPFVVETIDVEVTSTTAPGGLVPSLTLTETLPDSGIFKNTNLIFITEGLVAVGDSLTVSQLENSFGFTTNGVIDTISVEIKSTTDPVGFIRVLTETAVNSGSFTAQLTLSSTGPSGGNTIQVSDGDILSITYLGESTNTLVIPNTNAGLGALPANIGDTITATYLGASDTATILPGLGGGGGGGGIARAGFVVNVLAGASLFGGSGGGGPPSFGVASFTSFSGGEEGFGGILGGDTGQPDIFKVGTKSEIRLDFVEPGGKANIEHIAMYLNIRNGQNKYHSDTYISYDPRTQKPLTIHDPNGFFSSVNFEILQKDVSKFVLKIDITFAKPMETSDIILESWNLKRWSAKLEIPKAITVVPGTEIIAPSQPELPQIETVIQEEPQKIESVPQWIKNNAGWWADGQIEDSDFVSGIQFMLINGLIKIPQTESTQQVVATEIPDWIKNNAGWWAKGLITEQDFVSGLQWLVSNNIIKVT